MRNLLNCDLKMKHEIENSVHHFGTGGQQRSSLCSEIQMLFSFSYF